MCGSAVVGEFTIGRSESYDRGEITGSGCRKVGDGFNRFICIGVIGCLMGVIGRLEYGTGRGLQDIWRVDA